MLSRLYKWEGHVSFGPITIFGANAMHWTTQIKTRWGYVCFRPTTKGWPWKLYISPNATPWAAIFAIGPGIDRDDGDKAALRLSRLLRGLSFSTEPGTSLDEI